MLRVGAFRGKLIAEVVQRVRLSVGVRPQGGAHGGRQVRVVQSHAVDSAGKAFNFGAENGDEVQNAQDGAAVFGEQEHAAQSRAAGDQIEDSAVSGAGLLKVNE